VRQIFFFCQKVGYESWCEVVKPNFILCAISDLRAGNGKKLSPKKRKPFTTSSFRKKVSVIAKKCSVCAKKKGFFSLRKPFQLEKTFFSSRKPFQLEKTFSARENLLYSALKKPFTT